MTIGIKSIATLSLTGSIMPPRLLIPSADELAVSAFLATDEDSPACAAWKREHPDWFVAGTWTGGARAGATGGRERRRRAPAGLGVAGTPSRSAGIASWEMSATVPARPTVEEFKAIRAAVGLAGRAPEPTASGSPVDDAFVIPVQFRPRDGRRTRMPGGGFRDDLSIAEQTRMLRFDRALETIRRLDPRNRELTYVLDPNRVPPDERVLALEAEAFRLERLASPSPSATTQPAARPGEPTAPYARTLDVVMPGGRLVGIRLGSAGSDVQTVFPSEFNQIHEALKAGATVVSRADYAGTAYTRQDGTTFGMRNSTNHGPTLDVSAPGLPNGFRIHQR